MRISFKTPSIRAIGTLVLFGSSLAGFTQQPQQPSAQRLPEPVNGRGGYELHYPNSPAPSPFANGQTINALVEQARMGQQWNEAQWNHDVYLEKVRIRAAQMVAQHKQEAQGDRHQLRVQQPHAVPDAPDQSELLKNSKDRDFILHNFRTMYIDAHDAQFFSDADMKSALARNKDFEKLKIRIVDDPRVADAVFSISYTFAWEYPFQLRHQNTTFVLLAGKGEGPFYGPLGAVDVARQFVKAAKPWREENNAETKKGRQ